MSVHMATEALQTYRDASERERPAVERVEWRERLTAATAGLRRAEQARVLALPRALLAARPTRSDVPWHSVLKTRCTCIASPHVGTRTCSARSRGTMRSTRCSSTGSAYASVLPEPVGALTQMSLL